MVDRPAAAPDIAARAYRRSRDHLQNAVNEMVTDLLDGLPDGPTDLEAVADRLGVTDIEDVAGLPYSGALAQLEDGALKVLVAAEQPDTRRRFTIGHELGHVVLHRAGIPQGQQIESFCDRFAAWLLMPPAQAHVAVSEAETGYDALETLHLRFEVSWHSAAVRLSQLASASTLLTENGSALWSTGRTWDDGLWAGAAQRALAADSAVVEQVRSPSDRRTLYIQAVPARRKQRVVVVVHDDSVLRMSHTPPPRPLRSPFGLMVPAKRTAPTPSVPPLTELAWDDAGRQARRAYCLHHGHEWLAADSTGYRRCRRCLTGGWASQPAH